MGKIKKVKILFSIREEIDSSLRELIMKKYGEYKRGLLSAEVEKALLYWIRFHTHLRKGSQNAVDVYSRVKEKLIAHYGFPPKQVTRADLTKAIMETRGADPRTIKKWIETFRRLGLIKHISGEVWELQ